MTTYAVLDVTVLRSPCTHGRHHIREARLSPSVGVLVKVRLDRLLSMQPADTFVSTDNEPVAFVPCDCGAGYVVVPAGVVNETPGYI